MNTISTKTKLTGLAGVLAATALGVAGATAGMAPAHASASDTDRPKITEKHFDFGKNWAVSAPLNGGYMYWSLNGGVTTAELEGYLYLSDKECGRIHVEYYDDNNSFLAEKNSVVKCAPGNGKTQWWKTITYSNELVSEADISVQKQKNNGSFKNMGWAYSYFN